LVATSSLGSAISFFHPGIPSLEDFFLLGGGSAFAHHSCSCFSSWEEISSLQTLALTQVQRKSPVHQFVHRPCVSLR